MMHSDGNEPKLQGRCGPRACGSSLAGRRTLTSERFSDLSQINTKNVARLKVLCTYDTWRLTSFETGSGTRKRAKTCRAAPIAWEGLVFVGNAGGDFKGGKGHMYALDAKTGKIVWQFFLVPKTSRSPIVDSLSSGMSCARSLMLSKDKVGSWDTPCAPHNRPA
jgi:glucose dehydrogenase